MIATTTIAGAPSWSENPRNSPQTSREGISAFVRIVKARYAQLCGLEDCGNTVHENQIMWRKFAEAVKPFFSPGAGKREHAIWEKSLDAIRATKFKAIPRIVVPPKINSPKTPRKREPKAKKVTQATILPKSLPSYSIPTRVERARGSGSTIQPPKQSPKVLAASAQASYPRSTSPRDLNRRFLVKLSVTRMLRVFLGRPTRQDMKVPVNTPGQIPSPSSSSVIGGGKKRSDDGPEVDRISDVGAQKLGIRHLLKGDNSLGNEKETEIKKSKTGTVGA